MPSERKLEPERWVERHGDVLYRYALMRIRSPDAAAELLQETFVEALRSRETYSGRASERTWLFGIMKHKLLDRYRRERGILVDRSKVRRSGAADEGATIDHRLWTGDPARSVEQSEFWEVLSRCLGRLPERLSQAFILREIEEMDARTICELLDVTPASLWARLHRARLVLRECLERNWLHHD
jgi:RNA polymerase sigma-70 factor (ECF subfamily)